MNNPTPDPELIKVTEIFLIPSSFLVAALGTADTNFHRTAVSVVGLIISILWWICSREAFDDIVKLDQGTEVAIRRNRTWIMSWLLAIFVVGWFLSSIAHTFLWNKPLGVNLTQ